MVEFIQMNYLKRLKVMSVIRYLIFFVSISSGVFAKTLSFFVIGDVGYLEKFQFTDIGVGLPKESYKNVFHAPLVEMGKNQFVEQSGLPFVLKAIKRDCRGSIKQCHFGLVTGDLIYPYGVEVRTKVRKQLRTFLVKPYEKLRGIMPSHFKLYTVLGNHEWYSEEANRLKRAEPNWMELKIRDAKRSVEILLGFIAESNLWVLNPLIRPRLSMPWT
jgi:hypothetical protein